jgi:cyclic pyranopterin phosphate synthase
MVDISDKPVTRREARATARVRMSAAALKAIVARSLPKGEVLGTARLAGIQAAKRCSDLIPMCHPLPLTFVEVDLRVEEARGWIEIVSTVRCEARTGAEMEALTAAAIAALTVVDMAKSADPWMTIEGLTLLEKSGGKSGHLRRRADGRQT